MAKKKKPPAGQGQLGPTITRASWVGPNGAWAVFGPYGSEHGSEPSQDIARACAAQALDRVCRKPQGK